tara:strand:+ start:441 stop:845 length:405 start_codon:yes stop_codon:yes gene_type:complete
MSFDTIDLKPDNSVGFDIRSWKVKLEKTKRKGRVKISFKLSKEESEGFEAFMGTVKPGDLDKEDFIRILFFKGVETLNKEFSQIAKDFAEQKAGELALEGIDPEKVTEAADGVLNNDTQELQEDSTESEEEASA